MSPDRKDGGLSEKQLAHLETLNDGHGFRSAYGNGLHIGTLNSLAMRGLVKAQRTLGASFSPRTGILWQITAEGKAAIARFK